jgi:hypothetical protein
LRRSPALPDQHSENGQREQLDDKFNDVVAANLLDPKQQILQEHIGETEWDPQQCQHQQATVEGRRLWQLPEDSAGQQCPKTTKAKADGQSVSHQCREQLTVFGNVIGVRGMQSQVSELNSDCGYRCRDSEESAARGTEIPRDQYCDDQCQYQQNHPRSIGLSDISPEASLLRHGRF